MFMHAKPTVMLSQEIKTRNELSRLIAGCQPQERAPKFEISQKP